MNQCVHEFVVLYRVNTLVLILYPFQDGDHYTEAQCEAMVMCSKNHWIITPNLTRSIQIDLLIYVQSILSVYGQSQSVAE